TSGPGLSLKGEAMGLAVMLEIPLLIVDIQRGGPSTGLPTKTEQSDLLQAMHGRHGEAPLPVIAASTPSNCFDTILEAARIAIEYMTPVICLTDGYIANGAEPWRFPKANELKPIPVHFTTEANGPDGTFLPYKRDEKGSRPWVKPGTPGLMHRIGGLEKQHETGNVSYDARNHEVMTQMRANKIANIAHSVPPIAPDSGNSTAKLCVLGWGSTHGAIKTTIRELLAEGYDVAHVHLRHINPFPANLGELLKGYDTVLIPEMNCGQLLQLIRAKYLVPAIGFNKVQGLPFQTSELRTKILELLNQPK
ncbi:MAG: 2-oxoglutarate ferredoxin oxidoreductase subunit alpha, partial [Chitinophagia bacterium]|nr:2-oxoglutarate ferredoxin oxidoreductase subunit alpha [Chitinophagia bacterium]